MVLFPDNPLHRAFVGVETAVQVLVMPKGVPIVLDFGFQTLYFLGVFVCVHNRVLVKEKDEHNHAHRQDECERDVAAYPSNGFYKRGV